MISLDFRILAVSIIAAFELQKFVTNYTNVEEIWNNLG